MECDFTCLLFKIRFSPIMTHPNPQSQEMTVKSHGPPPPPPPPTPPQLLTIKEEADNKVPLVRMPQDDPLNPSSTKNYQVDSENNKEKFIKNP